MSENRDLENIILNYIDEVRFLFSLEQWSSALLDFSKNEILAIFLIYRREKVTMSEVAEYIQAPLNTATGIISRLEKKNVAERTRDTEDKRVVNIRLTKAGINLFQELLEDIGYYINKIYISLTKEEIETIGTVVSKVLTVLKSDKEEKKEEKQIKKIKKIEIE